MNKCTISQSNILSSPGNPFVVESPEKLTSEQLVNLFVGEYTDIETIKRQKHTFIWGSRGSGKSMMLRYLEPQCQALVKDQGIEAFLKGEDPFIAIYAPCKEGQINRSELDLIAPYAAMILAEHMMNLNIARLFTDCLLKQFPGDFFDKNELGVFAERIKNLFDRASISASVEGTNKIFSLRSAPLEWLKELLTSEDRKISSYLRENILRDGGAIYEGATSGYHDFLVPFFEAAQLITKIGSMPIYLLMDDAHKLTDSQQKIINTWIANRDQAVVCIKVSADPEGYKTLLTREDAMIETPHDYSEVNVDDLYAKRKDRYFKKVKKIANRRLALSSVPTKDIEEFLPADQTQENLLKKLKDETADEWKVVGEPGRQKDYVSRYASARLFQDLKKKKKRRNYAGFTNIVYISSGVIRSFLEPCYLMFDRCISEGKQPGEIKLISPNIQDDVLFKDSEKFIQKGFEDIKKSLPPEEWPLVESLKTLIESLGKLFYERLHDPEAREARIFSFTVRGQLSKETKAVLHLGVRHRYFQLRTYSSKEGGGREDWYILNRRLCPAFKLDPTGFEGRISITSKLLELATQNTSEFIRLRLKKTDRKTDNSQDAFFTLEEKK